MACFTIKNGPNKGRVFGSKEELMTFLNRTPRLEEASAMFSEEVENGGVREAVDWVNTSISEFERNQPKPDESAQTEDITPDGGVQLGDSQGQEVGEGDVVQPAAELATGEGALKDVESTAKALESDALTINLINEFEKKYKDLGNTKEFENWLIGEDGYGGYLSEGNNRGIFIGIRPDVQEQMWEGNFDKAKEIYKIEQSETPKTKSNEWKGVGIGRDVKIKYGGADKDLNGNPQKQWMRPVETSEQAANRLAEFVEASDYKGREQSTFIDRNGESVEVKLRNDDGKWNWYEPKSKKPFASFDNAKDAIKFIQKQPFWDNGELNKDGRNDAYFAKVHANYIKRQLENGNILEDINDGKISAKDAKTIIEGAGLEVPKDIAEQAEPSQISEEIATEQASEQAETSKKEEKIDKAEASVESVNKAADKAKKIRERAEQLRAKAAEIRKEAEKDIEVESVKLTPEENRVVEDAKIPKQNAKRAKSASPKRTRKSKSTVKAIEAQAKDVEANPTEESIEEVVNAIEVAEAAILSPADPDESFERKYGVSEIDLLNDYNSRDKRMADIGESYESLTGKKLAGSKYGATEEEDVAFGRFVSDFVNSVTAQGLKVKHPISVSVQVTVLPKETSVKPIKTTGAESLAFVVGEDIMRPNYESVFIEADTITATDGMVLVSIKKNQANEDIIEWATKTYEKASSKKQGAAAAKKLASENKAKLEDGGLDGKMIHFKSGQITEGEYMKYRSIVPKDRVLKATYEAQELADVAYSAEVAFKAIKTDVKQMFFRVVNSGKAVDFEIAVNPELLKIAAQALQANGNTEIDVSFEAPNRSILLEGNNGGFAIVMPTMIVDDIYASIVKAPPIEVVVEPADNKVKKKAATLRREADAIRKATRGTAMVAPKLYAAALDALATILESADSVLEAIKQWRQTSEYKALEEADRNQIEAEISELEAVEAELDEKSEQPQAGIEGAETAQITPDQVQAPTEVFEAIDPILEMKSGPEAVAARREYKEKYGKDTYEKAVKITRNFDKIVERLENEGKVKKKCP